ncbi:MAG: hypothetical protein LN413_06925 [Candidatus Thermoplasmatota archaeon]|nr:hypothetical protein [Candidatus Thermoplasmatota archaeon]
MVDFGGPSFQDLSRKVETYDFTVFDFPNATVTTTSTEEIEIDQALSLADRRGRRFFGAQFEGMLFDHFTEQISAIDTLNEVTISISTRTGDFHIDDPELLANYYWASYTGVAEGSAEHATEHLKTAPGGEIYVAPRLFFRLDNDLAVSIVLNTQFVRIASISQPLTFPVFIELLERFADVTLL